MALYSDINQKNTTEKILLLDVESVFQSIKNILSTSPGERLFNPEFGSQVESLLFEHIDDITELQMLTFIVEAIERWDDRVEIDLESTNIIGDTLNNRYDVDIAFRIKGFAQNQLFNYTESILGKAA